MQINKQTGTIVKQTEDGRVLETPLDLLEAHSLVMIAFARMEARMYVENRAGENVDDLINATHDLARAKAQLEKELDERRLALIEQASSYKRARL